MRLRTSCTVVGAAVALFAAGCAPEPAPEAAEPDLEHHVMERAPRTMEHRRFIDFGGKVHLLGYDIEPEGTVRPGSRVKVRMYWKSVSRLGPGWGLFTHLINTHGEMIGHFDNQGPLRRLVETEDGQRRQALPPSLWQLGYVYVDEQEIEIPGLDPKQPRRRQVTPEVTLVVGVWKEGMRLTVLSGPSDRNDRGIVTHIATGVRPPVIQVAGGTPRHPH